jgi:Tol biopolymer transport system component/DNA-binding winged helix-turn-helix (wHTH) protein
MSLEKQQFAFGGFVLDANERVLLRSGTPVSITPKTFQLLLVLVENHGHIVEKEKLMEDVWAGSFVEESNLTFTIRQLRKVLGDEIQQPSFVETIPRRGYRFIADVEESSKNSAGKTPARPDETMIALWRTRPIMVVIVLALLGAAALLIWREKSVSDTGLDTGSGPPLKFETIASSDTPMTAAISPDGNYVAYSRTTNGRQGLWLRQLSSGVNIEIIPPEDGIIYNGLEFSAGGEYIYFSHRLRSEPARIGRVSILGGMPNVDILNNVDGAFSVSPDDHLISFRRYTPQKRTLLIANSDGSDEREIYQTDKTFTDNVFSPDGKTIAFASGQSDTGERDFSVYTIGLGDKIVKPATDFKWVHVRGVAWLPDQSGLLVTASYQAGGPSQLWRISLSDGSTTRVLTSETGFVSISAAKDLKGILLTQVSRTSSLYLAPSARLGNPIPIVEASDGLDWTPNGGLVYSSPSVGNRDIWLLSSDKMSQKQLTTESSIDFDPVISPDGRYVVFVSDRAGKFDLWRIDADGNQPFQLTNGDGEQEPVFTADGKFVVYSSMKDVTLWKVPIEGGEPVQIYNNRAYRVSISPDGTKFAHFSRVDGESKILIRTLENGQILQEFDPVKDMFIGSDIIWSSDGKTLFYSADDSNHVSNLWKQPIRGGEPEKLTNYTSGEIFYFDFSPDDYELAMVRGEWKYEAVLLRGL